MGRMDFIRAKANILPLWIKRGGRYLSIGVSTFLVDLALLFFLIESLGMNVLVATGVAFYLAVSVNYFFSRKFVFKHTKRGPLAGYMYFMTFSMFALVLTVGFMALLEAYSPFHPVVHRILVACVVGIWNYGANLFLNFRVAGVELDKSQKTDID